VCLFIYIYILKVGWIMDEGKNSEIHMNMYQSKLEYLVSDPNVIINNKINLI